MNKIKDYLKMRGVKESDLKKFLVLIVGIASVIAFLALAPLGSKVGPIVALIIFSVLFAILSIIAGVVVFRSLLAASIGLSLLIFIGQSYCDPSVIHNANESLGTLLGIGFIYVIFQFFANLYKELFGDKDSIEELKRKGTIAIFKEINGDKHSWLVLTIYIPLVSLFVWEVFLVINPIRQSFCV